MASVELGRRHREVAEAWNQLSGHQLLQICQVFQTAYAQEHGQRRALLGVLLQVPARVLRQINAVQHVHLAYLTRFLREPTVHAPLTAQLLPVLQLPFWNDPLRRQYYGPLERFRNVRFSEFILADTYFLRYVQTSEAQWLDQLVAVLYRPQRAGYSPTAVTYQGDRREEFSEHLVAARTRRLAQLPPATKMAVLLYYQGCRRDLERRYRRVFSIDNQEKAPSRGWADVLLNLADGVHRLDATAGQLLHNVLREMERLLLQHDAAKEASQST